MNTEKEALYWKEFHEQYLDNLINLFLYDKIQVFRL